jgi:hypothetical protein
VDNILDFDGACEALDSDLRQAILAFSEDAMRLGQALGVQHAVPASFYESYRVAKAVSAIAASGRDLSMDQLLTVLTVSNGRGDMVKDLLHGDIKASGHKIELYNREIPFDVDSQHSTQNPTLRLAVQSGSVSLIDLEDARSAITTSPRSVLAKAEVILSFATAEMMSNLNSELLDVAALQPGITTLAHHKRQIAPHLNQDDATGAMGAFIEKLAIVLGDDSMQPLFAARHLLERFPLVERFHRAVEATAKADQTRLESWVRDELNKSYRGEIPRVSYDVLDREVYRITDEIRGNQGVAIVVSSGASGTKFKLRGVIPTDSAITESREAVLGGAAVLVKDQLRLRGQTIIIDAIAFSDPELCALLAGGGDGVQKTSRIVNAYEDTTVVVGIVAEDLRDLSNVDLVTQALNMSADQKARFLKRELIWPRMSYEEMKARGLLLQTAIALDTLWKGLPKTPKSPSAKHVRGFVQLLTMMREGCAQIVERIRLGELPDCPFGDAHYGGAKSRLDAEFRKVTHDACFSDAVRGAYQLRDFKVDGITGVSLCDYEPFSPHAPAMAQIMSTATWNGYLKERKIARSVHGSPVTRDGVITKGANYRKGISVNAADFLRTFGFCGVEYGNWTNQLEREKHLNFAYDSLMDIARAVGWEPMALSLGGRLRLCIGPRLGATNTGVAHSDPLNSAVNLTQLSGDGAVAHEYFHAIASHFGHIHTGRTDDISKAFAYGFQKPGQLPTLSNTPFREPVGSAFHNLQVAITRKPRPGGDPCNIDDYVDLSDMMVASNELGPAWAAPAEMFARAMELWLSAQLHTQGHRNERIVRWGGGVSVYPDENHLSRIKQWISPLLEAIQLEVSRVVHPTLGELAMPALNSENRSALALTHQDLIELATNELQGLFDEAASQPLLYSNEDVKSGYYNAVEHVLGLNDMYADHETFYHEAWRACESKLLTPSERGTLICLFAKNGSLAETVLQAMGDTGLSELAVSAATESSQELQAYAFQMWAVGKFDLADSISGFYRVKSFVDGVSEVAGLLGGEGVVSALRRFEEVSLSRGLEPVNGLADSYGVALHISVNRDEVLEGDRFQPLNSMRR